jgi:hypothetical protein
MGFTGIPGLSTQLKNSYTRVILPFEHYSERVRNSPALSPATNRTQDPQLKTHQNIQTPSRMNIMKNSPLQGEVMASPPSSPLSSVSTSSLSDAEDAAGVNKARRERVRDQQISDGGRLHEHKHKHGREYRSLPSLKWTSPQRLVLGRRRCFPPLT